jgi:hypothetical protein
MMLQCMFPLMKDYFNTSDTSSSVGSESGDSSVSTIFTPSPVREACPEALASGSDASGSEAGTCSALTSGPGTYRKPEDYTVTDQDGDLWLQYPTHTRVRFMIKGGEYMNADVKAWINLKNSDFDDDKNQPTEVWRCTYTQVPDDHVSHTPTLHTELTQS